MNEFREVTKPPSIFSEIKDNQSVRAYFGLIAETEKLGTLIQVLEIKELLIV